MSNVGQKLSSLPEATAAADVDLMYLVQGGVSKRIAIENLLGDLSVTKAAICAALGLTDIQVTDTNVILYKTGIDTITRRIIFELETY